MPASEFSAQIDEEIAEIDPVLGVETVYLFPASGVSAGREQMLKLYNMLRQVDSLKGIDYYSASRDTMRTFFKEFYPINNPEDRDRTDIPHYEYLPSREVQYAFQEDLTFGKSISKIVYRTDGPQISLSITNMTPLRYMLIPLIKEEKMQINIIIHVIDDHIIFYGNLGVKTIDLLGIAERKKESFSNRIEALYGWFTRIYGQSS
jgi:hypothetical protein